ncbi:hypothetical protein HDU97_002054 [Phlyctochytrium planicorne]|nr:hypothetical protein HDU97_002054 [Phlyctochytrium planicorne]
MWKREALDALPMFVNQSIVYRLGKRASRTGSFHSLNAELHKEDFGEHGRNKFSSEYRAVSVLFVQFLEDCGAQETFTLLKIFLDKVARLFAIKAAVEFASSVQRHTSFLSIAVATGEILFSTIGTTTRKEAGLLGKTSDLKIEILKHITGDVFNLAARFLSIRRTPGCVAFDDRTMELVNDHFECAEIGRFRLKGKDEEIRIWGIDSQQNPSGSKPQRSSNHKKELIGNFLEWQAIQNFQATSGMGKSNLLAQLQATVAEARVDAWIVRGNEVEQSSPFSILQYLYHQLQAFATQKFSASRTLPGLPTDNRLSSSSIWTSTIISRHNLKGNEGMRWALSALVEEAGENLANFSPLEDLGDKWENASNFSTTVDVKVDSNIKKGRMKAGMARILAHVATKYSIVFFLDDIQWFDTVSLEIFVAAFSRPLPTDSVVFSLKFDLKLELSGMTRDELVMFMVRTTLLDNIIQKTGGNLLQIDTMTTAIKEKIADEGTNLTRAFLETQLATFVSCTLSTVILSNFDRLDQHFRTILRYASIQGQYITIEDLLYLLGEGDYAHSEFIDEILHHDTYEFFKVEKTSLNDLYIYFRHIAIRNAIYESMALTERQQLHLKMAKRYESMIKTGNGDEKFGLLPLVYHHYLGSGISEKIIERGAELGLALFEDSLYKECSIVLLNVVDVMEQYCSSSADCQQILQAFLPRHKKAQLLGTLAYSCIGMVTYERNLQFAVEALELSGIRWPRTPGAILNRTVRSLFSLAALWVLTNGGAWTRSQRNMEPKPQGPIDLAINALFLMGNLFPEISQEQNILLFVWRLRYSLGNRKQSLSNWFSALSYAALLLARSTSGAKIGRAMIRKCDRIWKKCSVDVDSWSFIYGTAVTYLLLEPRLALEYNARGQKYWLDRNNPIEAFKNYTSIGVANHLMGNHREVMNAVSFEMANEMGKKERFWTASVVNMIMCETFTIDNAELFDAWSGITRDNMDSLPLLFKLTVGYCPSAMNFFDWIVKRKPMGPEFFDVILEQANEVAHFDLPRSIICAFWLPFYLFIALTTIFPALSKESRVRQCVEASKVSLEAFQNLQGLMQECLANYAKASPILDLFLLGSLILKCSHGYITEGCDRRPAVKQLLAFLNRKDLRNRLIEGGDLVTLGAMNGALVFEKWAKGLLYI